MTAAEVIARELADIETGFTMDMISDEQGREISRRAAAILAALRAAGFAVVPREATQAMLEAGCIDLGCRRDCNLGVMRAVEVYRAMVAAAEPRTGGE